MSLELCLSATSVFVSVVAAGFAGLSLWMYVREERRSRACVGEAKLTAYSGALLIQALVFPGRYFVQLKSIEVKGFSLASARFVDGFGWYPRDFEEDSILNSSSIPVNGGPVEVAFFVKPRPKSPITITFRTAGDAYAINYAVFNFPTPSALPVHREVA